MPDPTDLQTLITEIAHGGNSGRALFLRSYFRLLEVGSEESAAKLLRSAVPPMPTQDQAIVALVISEMTAALDYDEEP